MVSLDKDPVTGAFLKEQLKSVSRLLCHVSKQCKEFQLVVVFFGL